MHADGTYTVYAYTQRHKQVNSHTAASTLMMAVATGVQKILPSGFKLLPKAPYTNTPDSANEYLQISSLTAQKKLILPDIINANSFTCSKINTRLEIVFSFCDSKYVCIILCGVRIALVYSHLWYWDVMDTSTSNTKH